MQQAIPNKSCQPHVLVQNYIRSSTTATGEFDIRGSKKNMEKLVLETAIVVFARRGCCMGLVVKLLLVGLGVNPPVYEIDEEDEVNLVNNCKVELPAVFIGGALFGGLDQLMATHISGDLVPILKQAGALWL